MPFFLCSQRSFSRLHIVQVARDSFRDDSKITKQCGFAQPRRKCSFDCPFLRLGPLEGRLRCLVRLPHFLGRRLHARWRLLRFFTDARLLESSRGVLALDDDFTTVRLRDIAFSSDQIPLDGSSLGGSLFPVLERAVYRVRSISNRRFGHIFYFALRVVVLKVIDVLIDQTRLIVFFFAVLEDLGLLPNLYEQSRIIITLGFRLFPVVLLVSCPCLSALASEVVNFTFLDSKASRATSFAVRGDGNLVSKVLLVVLLAEARVNALYFTASRWAFRTDLIELDSMVNEALHLLIVNIFLHLLQVLCVQQFGLLRAISLKRLRWLLHIGGNFLLSKGNWCLGAHYPILLRSGTWLGSPTFPSSFRYGRSRGSRLSFG